MGSRKRRSALEDEDGERSEEEYEVEAVKKHKRRPDGALEYFVAWVGYPSEDGHDSWISEEAADGAQLLVDDYWKSLPSSKQAQRYLEPAAAPPVPKKARRDSDRKGPSSKSMPDTSPELESGDEIVDGRRPKAHEKEYHHLKDWEKLVSMIDTCEKDVDGVLRLFVIWAVDNTYSWVPHKVIRYKCPQKLIDFYACHLRFKEVDQSDDDEPEKVEKPL